MILNLKTTTIWPPAQRAFWLGEFYHFTR